MNKISIINLQSPTNSKIKNFMLYHGISVNICTSLDVNVGMGVAAGN